MRNLNMHAKKKMRKNISWDRLSSNKERWISRKEIVKIEKRKVDREREREREVKKRDWVKVDKILKSIKDE